MTILRNVDTGEDVPTRISRDLCWQPVGLRIGADEDEQSAALRALHRAAYAIYHVDRIEVIVSAHRGDLDLRPDAT